MNELSQLFAAFTPAAYGIWTMVIMVAGWFMREWRENRKLSLEDRLARRQGYETQVAALTDENRKQRSELQEMRQELDANRRACQIETDQLRDQLIASENRVSAILRKLADLAIRASKGELDAVLVTSILQLAVEADLRD